MHIIYLSVIVVLLVLLLLVLKVFLGGEKQMLVMLIVVNIIAERYTWERVPRLLKDEVREQLELMGVGHLAGE